MSVQAWLKPTRFQLLMVRVTGSRWTVRSKGSSLWTEAQWLVGHRLADSARTIAPNHEQGVITDDGEHLSTRARPHPVVAEQRWPRPIESVDDRVLSHDGRGDTPQAATISNPTTTAPSRR